MKSNKMVGDAHHQNPSIPEFFKGRDIFVTGGTGFMGKVLIEKLLRSCPDINKIYALIRVKKNVSIKKRIEELKTLPLFDRLKQENPSNLDKIIGINGDITEIGLGLSKQDCKRMENVSIIFHSAASVRFDDPLNEAVIMNTRGTREVILFAEKLKDLKAFCHVSTTYCNPLQRIVKEKIYPPNGDWKATIKLAEELPEALNILSQKYTNYEPNSYTFTKGLAEQVVLDYENRLPIFIFRPSIVIASLEEPMCGWVDNFNGPIGLLVACSLGIYRTSYGDPDMISDFTPVDTCIKAMIIATWKRAAISPRIEPASVYNCSTSLQRKFTTGFIVQMGEELSAEYPMDKMLWRPGGGITRCKYNNYIKFILFHLCTAYFVDFVLSLMGHKKFLAKLQRRIYTANLALLHFMMTHWVFENDKFLELQDCANKSDLADFTYSNFKTANIREYLRDCMLGARRFLLHEKDEDLPKARQNYVRMAWIDRIVKVIFYSSIAYFCYAKLGIREVLLAIL